MYCGKNAIDFGKLVRSIVWIRLEMRALTDTFPRKFLKIEFKAVNNRLKAMEDFNEASASWQNDSLIQLQKELTEINRKIGDQGNVVSDLGEKS